ncbi:hypothetical protein MANES_02G194150v8 [Manihot esculenta]|uniref:Uncharacterized protein n=1 Tax=Manihot esculenta TaxID=3983 RepID=A0ACB7I8J0_MANES|nr:hypothetical protein MANES_02G194150v8 [Manihot esculenta]
MQNYAVLFLKGQPPPVIRDEDCICHFIAAALSFFLCQLRDCIYHFNAGMARPSPSSKYFCF